MTTDVTIRAFPPAFKTDPRCDGYGLHRALEYARAVLGLPMSWISVRARRCAVEWSGRDPIGASPARGAAFASGGIDCPASQVAKGTVYRVGKNHRGLGIGSTAQTRLLSFEPRLIGSD